MEFRLSSLLVNRIGSALYVCISYKKVESMVHYGVHAVAQNYYVKLNYISKRYESN